MIFATCLNVSCRFYAAQVNRGAQSRQIVRLHQPIVAIQVYNIIPMPFGGQVGDIAIPVQQVKCGIILTQQIVFHDRRPDQVLAAQHIEREREEPSVHIALRCAERFHHGNLLIIDEMQQFAASAKIDLCGKKCCATNLIGSTGGCEYGEGCR